MEKRRKDFPKMGLLDLALKNTEDDFMAVYSDYLFHFWFFPWTELSEGRQQVTLTVHLTSPVGRGTACSKVAFPGRGSSPCRGSGAQRSCGTWVVRCTEYGGAWRRQGEEWGYVIGVLSESQREWWVG